MGLPSYVSGTEVLRSTVMYGGNSANENALSLGQGNKGKNVNLGKSANLQSVYKNAAVTITSVADGSGFCVFTLNSHGLAVGNALMISGATADSLNTVHVITAKDANTFTTNVPYVASGTAGSYQTVNGTMNVVKSGKYAGWQMTDELAGISSTVFDTTGNQASKAIHKSESSRRLDITGWNYLTGAAIKGSNAGDSYNHVNALSETPIDQAAYPSRAVPGELVFIEGPTVPVYKDYKAKNG